MDLRLGLALGRGFGAASSFFGATSGLCCVAESAGCALAGAAPKLSAAPSAPAAKSRDPEVARLAAAALLRLGEH